MKHLTFSTALVLRAIADGHEYGFDVMDAIGLPSGTVYPILRRLEGKKLLRSHWEKETLAHEERRPARKYYRVTRQGRRVLEQAHHRYSWLDQAGPVRPMET